MQGFVFILPNAPKWSFSALGDTRPHTGSPFGLPAPYLPPGAFTCPHPIPGGYPIPTASKIHKEYRFDKKVRISCHLESNWKVLHRNLCVLMSGDTLVDQIENWQNQSIS